MNSKIIGGIIAVVVLAVGAYVYINGQNNSSNVSVQPSVSPMASASPDMSQSPSPSVSPFEDKPKITLSEIAKHGTKDSCWMAVEGKVYDVTQVIKEQKHPGGAAILQGCGKDATQLFNTRPMGSKTPHSEKARDFLKGLQIGNLAQ